MITANAVERTPVGADKILAYKWTVRDNSGALMYIHKSLIRVHPDYQREVNEDKVLEFASDWSWVACGAIVLSYRDGIYWAIDGQHRLLAANRRSDIRELPCVVFQTGALADDARGFLDINSGRKPVTAIAKQRALVTTGDTVAVHVESKLRELGLRVTGTGKSAGCIKCIAWCRKRASDDLDRFDAVLKLGAEISIADEIHVAERVLEGLWQISIACEGGLGNKRLVARIRDRGARRLLDAAAKASSYYAAGGGAIWAKGMLAEINRGLQHKFTYNGEEL